MKMEDIHNKCPLGRDARTVCHVTRIIAHYLYIYVCTIIYSNNTGCPRGHVASQTPYCGCPDARDAVLFAAVSLTKSCMYNASEPRRVESSVIYTFHTNTDLTLVCGRCGGHHTLPHLPLNARARKQPLVVRGGGSSNFQILQLECVSIMACSTVVRLNIQERRAARIRPSAPIIWCGDFMRARVSTN